jgi:hypothetical protein
VSPATRRISRAVSRDTVRPVAFSDGVFAISITLLVLEIEPPRGDDNLLHGLLAPWSPSSAWPSSSRSTPSTGSRSGARAPGERA